jgi:hypothetical protein
MVSGARKLNHRINLPILTDQAYLDAISKQLGLNCHRSPFLFAGDVAELSGRGSPNLREVTCDI